MVVEWSNGLSDRFGYGIPGRAAHPDKAMGALSLNRHIFRFLSAQLNNKSKADLKSRMLNVPYPLRTGNSLAARVADRGNCS